MSEENLQTIEVNGIKMEIDLRHAKRIDVFKIGSPVKLLIKSQHAEPEVKSAVVVGFEPFDTLPTIIVAYLNNGYGGAKIEMAHINEKSHSKYEIVMSIDDDIPFKRDTVMDQMEKAILGKYEEAKQLERERDFFLKHFDCYFCDYKVERSS